jgi:hypothetical protein
MRPGSKRAGSGSGPIPASSAIDFSALTERKLDRLFDRTPGVAGPHLDRKLPRLDRGQVEKIRNDPLHLGDRRIEAPRDPAEARVARRDEPLEELGVQRDRVRRVPQVVADDRQELVSQVELLVRDRQRLRTPFEEALEPPHLRPLMTQLLSGQPLLIPDGLVGGIPTGSLKPVSVVAGQKLTLLV